MDVGQETDAFVAKYNGQYIDEDRSYGSQCWDVVARYAREVWGCSPFPTVSGGAEGLWRFYGDPRSNPISDFFIQVPRDQLQPGDIAVWDASFYAPYGHTALVWRRNGATIFVLEQDGSKDLNGDGVADGVSYIAHRTIINSLAGGLRPKGADMPTIAGRGDVESWYRELLGRDVDPAGYATFVGQDYKAGYELVVRSQEYALKKQQREQLQQERDTLYAIAEIRRQMLEQANVNDATMQAQLDAKQKELDAIQASNADLQKKIDAISGDSIVVTRSGWSKLFDTIKSFFSKNN